MNGVNNACVPVEEKADFQLLKVYRREAAEILESSNVIFRLWSLDWTNDRLLNEFRHTIQILQNRSHVADFCNIEAVACAVLSVLDAVASGKAKVVLMTETLQRALEVMAYLLTQTQKDSRKKTGRESLH